MTEEEKAKKKQELEDEIILALLIGFSNNAEIKAATAGGKVDLDKFPEHVREEALKYVNSPEMNEVRKLLEDSFEDSQTKPTSSLASIFHKNIKAATQAAVLKILAAAHLAEYFEVVGVDDEKRCKACKELEGKIFTTTGLDPRYPKLDKFLIDEGLHPNCRCYVHEIKAPKITTKDLTNMALNSANISDEVLYTSLVETKEDDIPTYDFGESLVQIAPIGVFEGTGADGNPYEENITKDALDTVLANYDGSELLLDVDHRSMKGSESDTKAAGWIYDLKVVDGLGRLDGLYGRIKWTDYGRNLIQTREYRFISPVFKVNNGLPFMLVNAGLTNRPALETIMPILNSKANDGETVIMNEDKENKEELKEEEKEKQETKAEETAENACSEEKAVENACEETKEEEKPVENACTEDTKPVENEQPKEEEVKEDKPKEEEKEVIKLEVLNQVPEKTLQATPADKMKIALGLKGKAFFDYLKANPDLKNM